MTVLALAENPVAIIERCMGRQRPVGAGAHRLLPLLLLLAGSAAAAFAGKRLSARAVCTMYSQYFMSTAVSPATTTSV